MNWGGKSTKQRTLVEEPSFSEAVKRLGGAEKIDPALDALIGALSRNPEGFETVPGFGPIRLAKTDPIDHGEAVPGLRLWFAVKDSDHVHLLWIEAIPEEP